MKYRNLVTGQVIDVQSGISGKNWECIGGRLFSLAPVIPDVSLEEKPVEEVKPVKKPRKTTKTSKK